MVNLKLHPEIDVATREQKRPINKIYMTSLCESSGITWGWYCKLNWVKCTALKPTNCSDPTVFCFFGFWTAGAELKALNMTPKDIPGGDHSDVCKIVLYCIFESCPEASLNFPMPSFLSRTAVWCHFQRDATFDRNTISVWSLSNKPPFKIWD